MLSQKCTYTDTENQILYLIFCHNILFTRTGFVLIEGITSTFIIENDDSKTKINPLTQSTFLARKVSIV